MTKTKKIVLLVAIAVIIALLVVAGVTGSSSNTVNCPKCDAVGTISCDDCGGSGLVLVEGVQEDCGTCEKTGIVECPECEGDLIFRASLWALLPPIIAIGLALITKEVYSSLFVGILSGGIIYSNFSFTGTFNEVVNSGLIEAVKGTAGIFIFLILLGIIVCLINKSGGAQAFGVWAKTHIKSRVGALLASVLLGILIFIDDYFNCLTVGSVMRPVTDSKKVSRAKLSYIIDATAAPVCMIAPISSWAAAVSNYAPKGEGLALFIQAIPYNFYSILTIVFVITMILAKVDFGPMKKHELNALIDGDLFTSGERDTSEDEVVHTKGKVIDLIIPIAILIVCSVFGLLYVGGIFDGVNFVEAFSATDATVGLPLGSLIALILIIIYLVIRKACTVKESMECIPKGFIAMVPAILILTFATALKNMTSGLGAKYIVGELMSGHAQALGSLLPAIIFIVACILAFATGTSWGTFGILIPIVTALFDAGTPLYIISMSACLAGAVCGDHCSPISDTTIMSSAGAKCDHLNHVSTQMPYAITVAVISFAMFVISGFVQNIYICLPLGIIVTIGVVLAIKYLPEKLFKKKGQQ